MNREILRLAIPNIISNVSVPMLSTVDTILMGQLSGLHIGAVGLGSMIFNFLYWNFVFLRMGTTGLTAQSFGKKNELDMVTTLGRALVTGIVLGCLLILFQQPIWKLSSILMNISPTQLDLVESYFKIRMLAAPATLALYALMGWYFGMQNAVYPLLITIFLNVINIVLSSLLVMHYHLDVEGVAYGTVVAQYSGLALAILLLLLKYPYLLKKLERKTIFIRSEILRFFSLNKDIFLRTLCLSFVFAFFYSQSSSSGELILASSTILLQFLNWMSYGIDGFAFAAESLTGKYFGAGDDKMLNQTIRHSFFWGAFLAVIYTLIYWVFKWPLLHVFTIDMAVIQEANTYYIWIILLPLIGFGSYIWDGIFVGLTAAKGMRNSMILSVAIYFIVFYLLKSTYGPQALWVALLVFLSARALFQSLLYLTYGKSIK